MKHCYLQHPIYLLVFVFIFITSCNGQPKTEPKTNLVNTFTPILQPKLIKNHFYSQSKEAADNVHCGLQDKAGNLWFGTTGDGAYCYDGKSFINFTMKDGLPSNEILSILEDNLGNIWFGTRNGACSYDGKTFTKITIDATSGGNFLINVLPTNNSGAKNGVWSMMKDKKGTLWFGTDEGVYCFNGKTFTRFLDNATIINKGVLTLKSVQYMLEDKHGNIWFGSGPMAFEGICLYDGKTLTNFKPNNQQWIRKIVESNNGNILFATRQAGIYSYNPSAGQKNGKTFASFPSPPKFFNGSLTNMLEDKAGNFWITSDYGNAAGDSLGGLWRSNSPTNKTIDNTFTKVTNKEVFFVLEDKNNNIWLGTRGTGLYRYDGKTFTKFSE